MLILMAADNLLQPCQFFPDYRLFSMVLADVNADLYRHRIACAKQMAYANHVGSVLGSFPGVLPKIRPRGKDSRQISLLTRRNRGGLRCASRLSRFVIFCLLQLRWWRSPRFPEAPWHKRRTRRKQPRQIPMPKLQTALRHRPQQRPWRRPRRRSGRVAWKRL